MKKFMITAVVSIMTLPLFSFSNSSTLTSELPVGECEAYCAGYADGLEAAGEINGQQEWTDTYNNCVDNSAFCNPQK